MKRRAGAGVLALGLLVASCGFGPVREEALRSAIQDQLPGVTEIRVGNTDGFTQRRAINLSITLGSHLPIGEARAAARAAARILWSTNGGRYADLGVTLRLPTQPGKPCDALFDIRFRSSGDAGTCLQLSLTVPEDAARRIWADDAGFEDPTAFGMLLDLSTTRYPGDPAYIPLGWQIHMPLFVDFRPDLELEIRVPQDTSDVALRAGADRVASVLWHEHPDRMTTLRLQIVRDPRLLPDPDASVGPPAPPRTALDATYAAAELRERFGPRAPDLPL